MNRGILSIAWSLADPELLLSCGKDNRILCWNPNTAEVKVDNKYNLNAGYLLNQSKKENCSTFVPPMLVNHLLESPGAVRVAHQQSVVL